MKRKFDDFLKEFHDLFSIETIEKWNENELIQNFFGCKIEGSSYKINHYLNKHFKTCDIHIFDYKFQFSIDYDEYENLYIGFEKATGKIIEVDNTFVIEEANRILRNLLLVNRNYKQIIEICNRYYLSNKMIYDISLMKKFNENFKNITYGERVLLAAYFPKLFTCFKTIDDEIEFFKSSKIDYNSNNILENIININKYCKSNQCNTFDIAYSNYNFAENKTILVNLDYLKYTDEQVKRLLKFGLFSLNKEYKLDNSPILYKLNLTPFENYYNEPIYFQYKNKLIAKFIINKCVIKNKSIEVELRNYKEPDVKITNRMDLPMYLIDNPILDFEYNTKKFPIIEQIKSIIQEYKRLEILSKLHLISYFKKETLQKYSVVEKKLYIISDIENKQLLKVIAYYNLDKDMYFMFKDDFYKQTQGYNRSKMMIELYDENKDIITFGDGESYLHLLGYNVRSNNGLEDEDRRELLCRIVSNGYIDKLEIISHLSREIQKRENLDNMKAAVSKWQSDIGYLKKHPTDIHKASHIYYLRNDN